MTEVSDTSGSRCLAMWQPFINYALFSMGFQYVYTLLGGSWQWPPIIAMTASSLIHVGYNYLEKRPVPLFQAPNRIAVLIAVLELLTGAAVIVIYYAFLKR